jgi:hypothetical protein
MANEAGTLGGAGRLFGQLVRDASRRPMATVENPVVVERIPRVSYGHFLTKFRWIQGEHITEIGPTGYGKTTLAQDLLTRRDFVLTFGTKARDSTMQEFIARGYRRVQSFEEITIEDRRVALWPDIRGLKSANEIVELQRERFREALFGVFVQEGWCVYLDELRYITSKLGLSGEVELLWEQGRSLDISVVAGYQRPRNIPLLAYDQPEHLIFFKETDRENLDRMAEIISWLDRKEMIRTIVGLEKYDFLYLNKATETAMISRVEKRR